MEPRARSPLVEHLAHLDALGEEPVADRLDVGDDQVQPPGRAGRGGGQVRPKLDRAPGARGRELDQAEVPTGGDVGVEPPAEASVELLCAIDIRDGDDDHLESRADARDGRGPARVVATDLGCAHVDLHWSRVGGLTISPRSRAARRASVASTSTKNRARSGRLGLAAQQLAGRIQVGLFDE